MTLLHFNLEHGVRQGDPLSRYLFILAVETMATVVREMLKLKELNWERKRPSSFNTQTIQLHFSLTQTLPLYFFNYYNPFNTYLG